MKKKQPDKARIFEKFYGKPYVPKGPKHAGITFVEEGNKTLFSCGCKIEVIGENFVMVPCSFTCEVYRFALEESKKQGNKISYQFTDKDAR